MDELIRAADGNQVEAWRRMLRSPGTREATFGSVHAVATGSPLDLFNPVFALAPVRDAEGEVGGAVRFVEAAGAPPLVYVHPEAATGVLAVLESGGLVATERAMPGMLLEPIPRFAVPASAAALDIRRVADPAALQDLVETVARGFGMPPEPVRGVLGTGLLDREDIMALCGYLEGRPVGTSMLVLTEGMAGVYTVAVVPEVRRRGFGRALTQRAIEEGRQRGATRACLQASSMGEPVYRDMGFRTVTSYRLFARPTPRP